MVELTSVAIVAAFFVGGIILGCESQQEWDDKKLRLFRRAGNDSIDAFLGEKKGGTR
jgi:hypothetical protein